MANNYFCIAGKLTKFEIRKAGSEHKIAELTIAAYNGADADCPVYVQAKQWNPTAKTKKMLKQVLENEGRVQATGRARMDTWDDKETDKPQYKLYLLADDRDGILEADEPEEYDENDRGGDKGKSNKSGGKKKRGNKNTQKKKGKGKKKRREEEEEADEEEDDSDDEWDEDD